jgi:hypothetical protein
LQQQQASVRLPQISSEKFKYGLCLLKRLWGENLARKVLFQIEKVQIEKGDRIRFNSYKYSG